jgi:methionyl-tRNA formyltransferase
MGTTDFAVESLRAIQAAGIKVDLVVTTPDRFGGRGGRQLLESDVKKYALACGLPFVQPEKLRDPVFFNQLEAVNADVFVVVAFRMLPELIWRMPRLGTLNLHGSLLPAYRGAAPIHWAVVNGETETGVSTFLIDQNIDSGNILMQKSTTIGSEDTFGEVYERLKHLGANLLVDTLHLLEKGALKPFAQNEDNISHAPKLNRDNCMLDRFSEAFEMHNKIRGLSPYPGAWTSLDGVEVKLFKSRLTGIPVLPSEVGNWQIEGKKLYLMGRDERLEILEIQPQGKRRMQAADFVNGIKIQKD